MMEDNHGTNTDNYSAHGGGAATLQSQEQQKTS